MIRRATWVALAASATIALAIGPATGAEAKPRKYSWEISPYIGARDYDSSLGGLSTHGVFGARLGFNLTRHVGIEATAGFDNNNSDTQGRDNVDVENWDLNVVLNFNTDDPRVETYGRWYGWDRWVPYVTVGLGAMSFDEGTGERDGTTLNLGVGTRIMVNDIAGVRFDLRNYTSLDDDEFADGGFDVLEGSVGLSLILGGRVPRDSDSDGVIDRFDRCPGTPLGCWVDEVGCPADSDGDGVCDGLDRCPNTPPGCPVDQHGCPVDEDGDGVCDGLDDCPGTPAGCWVDERGCPRDSDGDGVCDGVDRCPDTPAGCRVDRQGCPLDEDGDGVCDGVDQCPGTPRGTKVDARGCPVEVVRLVLANVHFEFNKSDIQPFYQGVLDQVASSLLANDWRSVEIELRGHTDSIDTVEYNYRLGQARADSVKDYLVARGVAPARLIAKSFSELEPVATNESAVGRALNRRVEMVPTRDVPQDRTRHVRILVRDVMFPSGASTIGEEGRRYLDQLAEAFAGEQFESMRYRVIGHAGGAGRERLSHERAEAVRGYLIGRGVDPNRIDIERGDTGQPKAVVLVGD